MSSQALLCSALERVNHIFNGEKSAKKEVLEGVEQLKSDLGRVADTFSDESYEDIDALRNQQLRELANDVDDSVDRYFRRHEEQASKWRSQLRCLLKYHNCAGEITSFLEDVEVLCRRSREVMKSKGTSMSITISEGEEHIPNNETYPDNSSWELLQQVVEGESGLSVIAICGLPGSGKTTLAQSVYKLVVERFACRGWVTVGFDFMAREVLETLLLSVSPNYNKSKEAAAVGMVELSDMLYKALKGKKYLLVLDDVCVTEAWDSLRFVFPDDKNGSRIIITTRSREVADSTSNRQISLKMQQLTQDMSWDLFLGLLKYPDDMEPVIAETGKQIVNYCKGSQFAITLMAKIMSKTSFQNWERILRGLHSKEHVHHPLDFSYTCLPFRLKPSFLYMGCFPRDKPILVDKLHLLWMVEGLISKTKEGAEKCLKELVDRKLVIGVEEQDSSLDPIRFVSCHLQNLIHDLCISKGKEEDFFQVIDFSDKLSTSSCRLAVHLNKFEDTNDVLLNIPDAKHIRSILFFDTLEPKRRSTWPSQVADLTNFQGIRVLDFDGVNFKVIGLPRGIEKLIYLRHLSFRGCYLEEFPSSFGSFSFLETLDLRVIDSCIMTIPNVLRKLTRLRHLYFPLAFRCHGNDEKLKLDSLKNLEVVENFHADSCDAGDLLLLENLKVLKGGVDGNNLDLENIINSIEKMNCATCHSSLVIKRFDSYSEGRRSLVAKLLQCKVVRGLELEGYLGSFPRDIVFSSNFTEMVLDGSELSESPMPILGKLPLLKSLVLCNDAFVGSLLVCYESDFVGLTSLKLASLQYLEEWEVESAAMPRLSILTIEQCDKLEMLPSELMDIPTLQKLMIISMPEKFQTSVARRHEGRGDGYWKG